MSEKNEAGEPSSKADKRLVTLGDIKGLLQAKKADGGKRFNELAYAEKLLKLKPLKEGLRCVGDAWYVYEDGAWLPRTREEFEPLALATIKAEFRKADNAAKVLKHVQMRCQVTVDALCGFHRQVDVEGGQAVLLNAANGVVWVWPDGSISLEKHEAGHGFTSKAHASWDETAECDLFKGTLARGLPDAEDVEMVQIAAGNFLWPTTQFEACLIFIGPGGGGKSKIGGAMINALVKPKAKSELVTYLSIHSICDPKGYSLHKLAWAAVNWGAEVSTIDMDDSSNFKIAVSGEPLDARQIYKSPGTIYPRAKLFFLANAYPIFKNGSEAERRRLRIAHFKRKVPDAEKDTMLEAKLAVERDGIFRWMVEGKGADVEAKAATTAHKPGSFTALHAAIEAGLEKTAIK